MLAVPTAGLDKRSEVLTRKPVSNQWPSQPLDCVQQVAATILESDTQMLKLSFAQLHQPVLNNLDLLAKDVTMHLQEYRPDLFNIYPAGYLRWVIRDSVEAASRFSFGDVRAVRTFVQLRWDVSPGFYRHPDIAAVLSQVAMPGLRRFEELAKERYADAWLAAMGFDDAEEWRGGFWQ